MFIDVRFFVILVKTGIQDLSYSGQECCFKSNGTPTFVVVTSRLPVDRKIKDQKPLDLKSRVV